MIRQFFAYYRPYQRLFYVDFGCAVIVGILELAFPLAINQFVDNLLPGKDWLLIILATVILLGIYALNTALQYKNLFEVYKQTATDSPDVGGSGVATYEEYVRQNLIAKRTIRDAYFVAVRGEECIGLSELYLSTSPGRFDTGTTVVKREYRRLGIALGLKLRAIEYAQNGKVIATGFAADNRASVNLNLKLGFVCEPSWITFRKSLTE